LVTIVGPGGIGKTTLAIVLAPNVTEKEGESCFLDLGPVRDPVQVPALVAAAISSEHSWAVSTSNKFHSLWTKRRLLILDNCERVADAAAMAVEDVLRRAPEVKVIVTSREPLRAEGEVVHRLGGLVIPAIAAEVTADDALNYSAVRLFAELARAAQPDFILTDELVSSVVEICRRVDGCALAIQLAANRVPVLGVRVLADRLAGGFDVLTNGQRATPPRHQSLEADFNWSFELLSDVERRLLTRLSVFGGVFDINAAIKVAGWDQFDEDATAAAVASLVDKSLVICVGDEQQQRLYRLFESAKAFARARLPADDATELAGRHARYVTTVN
jgi:predicted ATPase